MLITQTDPNLVEEDLAERIVPLGEPCNYAVPYLMYHLEPKRTRLATLLDALASTRELSVVGVREQLALVEAAEVIGTILRAELSARSLDDLGVGGLDESVELLSSDISKFRKSNCTCDHGTHRGDEDYCSKVGCLCIARP